MRRVLLSSQILRISFARCIRDNTLRLIGVYASNKQAQWPDILGRIKACLSTSRRVDLAGDSNAVFEPDLKCIGAERPDTKRADVKQFWDFVGKFDLSISIVMSVAGGSADLE